MTSGHCTGSGPQPQALHFSYRKGRADAARPAHPLERRGRPGRGAGEPARRRLGARPTSACACPASEPIPADSLAARKTTDRYASVFRLPPPPHTRRRAELLWRERPRCGQLTLPVLSRDEFLRQSAAADADAVRPPRRAERRLPDVRGQRSAGLVASAMLTSPTSLVPLLDLGLHVEFRPERAERAGGARAAVQFAAGGRQALVTVVPRRIPAPHRRLDRRPGWSATARWPASGFAAISQRTFPAFAANFGYSVCRADGGRRVTAVADSCRRWSDGDRRRAVLPGQQQRTRHGRPVHLADRVPRCPAPVQLPLLQEQEVLVTDGPTMVGAGHAGRRGPRPGQRLRAELKGDSLGMLPLTPVPPAIFTSEGGFKPTADFTWSTSADEELNDRLARLIEGSGREE